MRYLNKPHQQASGEEEKKEDDSDPWWVWPLVGLGALLAVCGILAMVAGRRKKDTDLTINDFMALEADAVPMTNTHWNEQVRV